MGWGGGYIRGACFGYFPHIASIRPVDGFSFSFSFFFPLCITVCLGPMVFFSCHLRFRLFFFGRMASRRITASGIYIPRYKKHEA